jgi:hypothetical protein
MRQLGLWLAQKLRTFRSLAGARFHQLPPNLPASPWAPGELIHVPITTEADWLASENPLSMLSFLARRATDRQFRLFAVACGRRLAHLPDAGRYADAIDVAERFADGGATDEELLRGRAMIGSSYLSRVLAHVASPIAWHAAEWGINGHWLAADPTAERAALRHLLADVFGNPFRPPSLLSGEILSQNDRAAFRIAQTAYEQRAFDQLPVLADALEDAGCTDEAILAHCRGEGPHVRGCWVVDLVLGKL